MKNLARRFLRFLHASRLRARSQPLQLSQGATALVLAPHPDDEALGCGALLAQRAASGAATVVAFFTSGESSHRGHSVLEPADVAALRQEEAMRAMASIGLPAECVRFCHAPDGRLDKLSKDEKVAWTECLRRLVAEVRPAEIFLPCRNDGSTEHEAMFGLLAGALATLPAPNPRVLEFPVWAWWSPRHLARVAAGAERVWRHPSGAFAQKKRSLLGSYTSQTEPSPPFRDPILPRSFAGAFDTEDEFFFESPLPRA